MALYLFIYRSKAGELRRCAMLMMMEQKRRARVRREVVGGKLGVEGVEGCWG